MQINMIAQRTECTLRTSKSYVIPKNSSYKVKRSGQIDDRVNTSFDCILTKPGDWEKPVRIHVQSIKLVDLIPLGFGVAKIVPVVTHRLAHRCTYYPWLKKTQSKSGQRPSCHSQLTPLHSLKFEFTLACNIVSIKIGQTVPGEIKAMSFLLPLVLFPYFRSKLLECKKKTFFSYIWPAPLLNP